MKEIGWGGKYGGALKEKSSTRNLYGAFNLGLSF